jgi:GNAT superfamily N-acetyltransferase
MEIKKLSPELADDYIGYMGGEAFSDNADWANCYCLESHFESRWDDEPRFNSRKKARKLVLAGQLTGYLAYRDGKVVGWVNANDKTAFCRLKEEWGVPEPGKKVKSIVCFVVAPSQRGQGIASALLERVCSDAERDGYDYVEGYPAAGDTFNTRHYRGPASMYEKQGFTAKKEPDGERSREPIMRKCLRFIKKLLPFRRHINFRDLVMRKYLR